MKRGTCTLVNILREIGSDVTAIPGALVENSQAKVRGGQLLDLSIRW